MKQIEKLGSGACKKALAEVEKRLGEVQARIEQVKPPPQPRGATGPQSVGAPRFDPLKSAGAEYAKLVEDGTDPAALAALVREHEELVAERAMLHIRRDKLRDRVKAAEHEEAVREAPGKAKRLLGELAAALDREDAALLELADARDERTRIVRELDAVRSLNDGEPYWSPALVRRVWAVDELRVGAHQLRGAVSTRSDSLAPVVRNDMGQPVVRGEYLRDVEKRLKPPAVDLEPLRRRYQGEQLAEHHVKQAAEAMRRERNTARARELAEPIAS